jgi:hypothetical protein
LQNPSSRFHNSTFAARAQAPEKHDAAQHGLRERFGKEMGMEPETAAEWMAERVRKQGRLHQGEAAAHLMQFRDWRLAYRNDEDQACVGRWVLRRFRSRYPGFGYDRRLKCWRRRD